MICYPAYQRFFSRAGKFSVLAVTICRIKYVKLALTLVRCFSLTSRVHRKPKCDTHVHLCLIFGNIPILTNLSTLITKINVAKLNSSVKVKVWAFHYDVIVQTTSFVPFNNSKFITDKNSFKALQVYCKVYSKNF